MRQDTINNMSMLELFKMEVASQCLAIRDNLASIIKQPNYLECSNGILRAIHSIKGAAAIIDIAPIVEISQLAESTLSSYDFQHNPDDLEFFSTLARLTDFFEDMIKQETEALTSWLAKNSIRLKDISLTLNSFLNTPEDLQYNHKSPINPQEETDQDQNINLDLSMFGIFKDDANGHCSSLGNNLLQLEKNPNALLAIESSMRSTHSLKGAARVIGLLPVVELTHAMEEVFIAAQTNGIAINNNQIDLLFSALDFLGELIALEDLHLTQWLRKHHKRCRALVMELESAAKNEQFNEKAEKEIKAQSQQQPKKEIVLSNSSVEYNSGASFIKISTDGLNRLMGLTGEMLAEAKWQPTLLKNSYNMKRIMDGLLKQMEGIRKKFHSAHFDKDIDESFKILHKKGVSFRSNMSSFVNEIEEHTRSANEISPRLHKELINNRMQPFKEGIKDLPRMVRDQARKLNKEITLKVVGAETLVDRDILGLIKSPLNHLISNAIDHGIETPSQRREAGKSENATIQIEAKHLFGTLQIIVVDDGRGIDLEKLRQVVVARNFVSQEIAVELHENELLEFLFLPNFSTKTKANHLSGRGVGLDIVQSIIRETRGSVEVSTIEGKGTIFELQLPLTLSISKCLIVSINHEVYGFPLVRIDQVTKIPFVDILDMGGHQYVNLNNSRICLFSAQQFLDLKEPTLARNEYELVILHNVTKSYGIIVDKIMGVRDLVVQPLTSLLGKLRSISAASISEDGTPILILDTQDLIQSMDHLLSGERLHHINSSGIINTTERVKTILVIDDSATVREVEKKLLTGNGYKVMTAVDGIDGWHQALKHNFDLIITDIDMPHMDGIELVLQLRDNDRFESIPIIIVSYKNREKDRNRGLEAGADYYLTKESFQDQTLLDAVNDLIGVASD